MKLVDLGLENVHDVTSIETAWEFAAAIQLGGFPFERKH